MAYSRLALAHSLRYSDTLDELLSDAFLVAVFDTVRGRHSLVYAVVYGGQLRQLVHGLLLPLSLLPLEK